MRNVFSVVTSLSSVFCFSYLLNSAFPKAICLVTSWSFWMYNCLMSPFCSGLYIGWRSTHAGGGHKKYVQLYTTNMVLNSCRKKLLLSSLGTNLGCSWDFFLPGTSYKRLLTQLLFKDVFLNLLAQGQVRSEQHFWYVITSPNYMLL